MPGCEGPRAHTDQAVKMRTEMLEVLSQSRQVLDSIRDLPSWKWADNQENRGNLKAKMTSLKDGLTGFCGRFVCEDIKQLAKECGTEKLQFEVGNFLEIRPKFNELKNVLGLIVARKQISIGGAKKAHGK